MSDSLEAFSNTLRSESGFVELSSRCYVRLSGEDRKKFLHNFCTNEIKGLADGRVCEAFVLNEKGKILAYVHVIAAPDELMLTGHGDQAKTLISHLDKYLIREGVTLTDATQEIGSLFVRGEKTIELLSVLDGELPGRNEVATISIDGVDCQVSHLELAGFGFLVSCAKSDLAHLNTTLSAAGVAECSEESLEIIRVEEKTPWFGADVDDSNLPQELQRDEIAISFDKGCYLGQETVARIDARGRVNWLLVGLKFTGESASEPGDELSSEGKPAGRVTSVVYSYQQKSNIGIGYVRRGFQEAGTELGDSVFVI